MNADRKSTRLIFPFGESFRMAGRVSLSKVLAMMPTH